MYLDKYMFVFETVFFVKTAHFYQTGKILSYHLRGHKLKVKMKEKKRIMIGCGNHIDKPN